MPAQAADFLPPELRDPIELGLPQSDRGIWTAFSSEGTDGRALCALSSSQHNGSTAFALTFAFLRDAAGARALISINGKLDGVGIDAAALALQLTLEDGTSLDLPAYALRSSLLAQLSSEAQEKLIAQNSAVIKAFGRDLRVNLRELKEALADLDEVPGCERLRQEALADQSPLPLPAPIVLDYGDGWQARLWADDLLDRFCLIEPQGEDRPLMSLVVSLDGGAETEEDPTKPLITLHLSGPTGTDKKSRAKVLLTPDGGAALKLDAEVYPQALEVFLDEEARAALAAATGFNVKPFLEGFQPFLFTVDLRDKAAFFDPVPCLRSLFPGDFWLAQQSAGDCQDLLSPSCVTGLLASRVSETATLGTRSRGMMALAAALGARGDPAADRVFYQALWLAFGPIRSGNVVYGGEEVPIYKAEDFIGALALHFEPERLVAFFSQTDRGPVLEIITRHWVRRGRGGDLPLLLALAENDAQLRTLRDVAMEELLIKEDFDRFRLVLEAETDRQLRALWLLKGAAEASRRQKPEIALVLMREGQDLAPPQEAGRTIWEGYDKELALALAAMDDLAGVSAVLDRTPDAAECDLGAEVMASGYRTVQPDLTDFEAFLRQACQFGGAATLRPWFSLIDAMAGQNALQNASQLLALRQGFLTYDWRELDGQLLGHVMAQAVAEDMEDWAFKEVLPGVKNRDRDQALAVLITESAADDGALALRLWQRVLAEHGPSELRETRTAVLSTLFQSGMEAEIHRVTQELDDLPLADQIDFYAELLARLPKSAN